MRVAPGVVFLFLVACQSPTAPTVTADLKSTGIAYTFSPTTAETQPFYGATANYRVDCTAARVCTFTNLSTAAVPLGKVFWALGGATWRDSKKASPVKKYAKPGTYAVALHQYSGPVPCEGDPSQTCYFAVAAYGTITLP